MRATARDRSTNGAATASRRSRRKRSIQQSLNAAIREKYTLHRDIAAARLELARLMAEIQMRSASAGAGV